MKKITTLLACIAMLSFCSAQQASDWKNIDSKTPGTKFYGFVGAGEDYSLAVITKPMAKDESGNPARIRKYNADFSSFEDFRLPDETPMFFNLLNFSEHVILNGYSSFQKGPLAGTSYEQVIMCLTDEGQVQEIAKINSSCEKGGLDNTASLYTSSDGASLIMVSVEDLNYLNPLENEYITRILVFDKDFKLLWRDSLKLEEKYGKGTQLYNCQFDFTNNGKLLLIVNKPGNSSKKEETKVTMCIYDAPGQEAHSDVQTFGYNYARFKHVLLDDGMLYLCGVTESPNAVGMMDNGFRNLFVVKKNCATSGSVTYNDVILDKAFYESYPDYLKTLKPHLQTPASVLPMKDGLLYMSQFGVTGENSISSTSQDITLVKFGFDGKLQWLKMINKNVRVYNDNAFFKAFSRENDVVLFYADLAEKATSSKPSMTPTVSTYGLAMAIVSPDGTITETMLDARSTNKTIFQLKTLFKVDDNYFLIKGDLKSGMTETDYLRSIEL